MSARMVVMMEIKRLHLKNFRNYKDEEIVFSKNTSVIYGENAQGKTNIIEALYMISTGKSHRTNNNLEMIQYGENYFDIVLEFEENHYSQSIELKYEKGKGKELYINEVKKNKMSEILGVVHAVLFAPESLLYVKGAPGERRRLMDIVLCQIDKKYLINLQKYNRIIKNRNLLLRKIKQQRIDIDQLDIWDESLTKTGTEIIEKRIMLMKKLEGKMNRIMNGLSDGNEYINIKYKSFSDSTSPVYENLLKTIKSNREREIETGNSLYGPHRDDLEINVNRRHSRIYCSQGQQRSVALALNIAILEEIEEEIEKKPLLLLDDVMSELDEKRQSYLMQIIKKRQTIITTTNKKSYVAVEKKDNSYIRIKEGKVIEYTTY